jgi:hypothetical protein
LCCCCCCWWWWWRSFPFLITFVTRKEKEIII